MSEQAMAVPSAADVDRALRELKQSAVVLAQAWQALRRVGWSQAQLRPVLLAVRQLGKGCERLRLGAPRKRVASVEQQLRGYADADCQPSDVQFRQIEAALSALSSSILAIDGQELTESFRTLPPQRSGPAPGQVRVLAPERVLLLGIDDSQVPGIEAALRERGWQAHVLESAAQLKRELIRALPGAVLIEAGQLPLIADALGLLHADNLGAARDAQLLVLVTEVDPALELLAARSGARQVLKPPFDALAIVGGLQRSASADPAPSAVQVLIWSARRELATTWAGWLQERHYGVQIEAKIDLALRALRDKQPAVIVLDAAVGTGSILLATRAIRELTAAQTLSIVVVDGSNRLEDREQAIAEGADEYLLAPLRSRHLLSVVGSRIQRSQRLRWWQDEAQPGGRSRGFVPLRHLIGLLRPGDEREAITLVALGLDLEAQNGSLSFVLELEREAGSLLDSYLLQHEYAAVVHGGMFVLGLRRSQRESAFEAVERIRKSIAASTFRVAGQTVHCTASAGLAPVRSGSHGFDIAFREALAALKAAQHVGGNRALWFDQRGLVIEAGDDVLPSSVRARDAVPRFEPVLPLTGAVTGQYVLRWTWGYAERDAELMARLDAAVERELVLRSLDLRMGALKRGRQVRVIHPVRGDTVLDPEFKEWLAGELRQRKLSGTGLALMIESQGALERRDQIRRVAGELRPLGVRLGLADFGRDLALVQELRQLGIEFVLLVPEISRAVLARDDVVGALIRRIRQAGVVSIATDIETPEAMEALARLRVDYAVSERLAPSSVEPDFDFQRLAR